MIETTKDHDFCDYIHVFNAEESIGIIYEIVRPTVLPDLANGVAILLVFHITIDCHWYWSLVCLICSYLWQRIKYKYFWNCMINRVARYALHYCQVYETGLPDKLFSINFCFQWLGNIIQFINETIQFQWQLIKFK